MHCNCSRQLCSPAQGREALPSLRYLKLIREGAEQQGLAPEYRAWLDQLEHYEVGLAFRWFHVYTFSSSRMPDSCAWLDQLEHYEVGWGMLQHCMF